MILFLNVFITDDALTYYDRGLLGPSDRLNVFKYSLASFAVIPWSAVVIYCELDKPFAHRRAELEDFVYKTFPAAQLSFSRNTSQAQWQKTVEKLMELPDDLVWFFCNDDHIFLDKDLRLLELLEKRLAKLSTEHEFASCYASHWPEMLQFLDPELDLNYAENYPRVRSRIIEERPDYFINVWSTCDSIQIVNKRLLHYWWFAHDYGDMFLPRTDFHARGRNVAVESPQEIAIIIPFKEICRHYDGYSHVKMDINRCPPPFIPQGFFENDIRISFGSTPRKEGWLKLDPASPNYSSVDPQGADMRLLPEDLPLFWKGRISDMELACDPDDISQIAQRNHSVLRVATAKCKVPAGEILNRASLAFKKLNGEIPLPAPLELEYPCPDHTSVYKRNRAQQRPLVSIVVVESARGRWGDNCVQSLLDQEASREKFEIVLASVCDSVDGHVIRKADTALHTYRLVEWKQGTFHKHAGFNAAALECRADTIVLTESDCLFPRDWVANLIKHLELEKGARPGTGLIWHHPPVTDSDNKRMPLSLTISRSDFLVMQGCDESEGFIGGVGGLEELVLRLIEAGVKLTGQIQLPFAEAPRQDAWNNGLIRFSAFPGRTPDVFCPQLPAGQSSDETSHPAPIDKWLRQVNAQLLKGDIDSAQVTVEKASGSGDALASTLAATLSMVKTGNAKYIISSAEALSGSYPSSADLQTVCGILAFVSGEMQLAGQFASRALEISNSNCSALMLAGLCCRRSGDSEGAERIENLLALYYPYL